MPMASSEAIADIQTFVTNHAASLDAIVGGVIQSAQVSYALTLPGGLNDTPDDDRPVSRGGLFAFSAAGTAYRSSIYVPTIIPTLVANNGDIARAGATDTWLTDLLSGTEVSLTDKFENVLTAFLEGSRANRK